jgi:crossover junction endodeoxyribonuclease RuvC
MLVVGIDPGTATTGYGFIRETSAGGLEVVDFGVVTTAANLQPEVRLLQLNEQLEKLLALHRPDSGAVEKLFFQKNVKTAIAVGQARGVILLSLAKANLPVFEYTPLEVKLAVVGYGAADKNQVQQMVKAILNLSKIPKPDDAADALAIAICHLHNARILQLESEEEC